MEVLRKAIDKFGKDMQCMVAVEELSELQKEISKAVRGKHNREELIEEIADVTIMIDQLRIMFDIEVQDVGEVIQRKLERLGELVGDTE